MISDDNTHEYKQTWTMSTPTHKRRSERENICQRNHRNDNREQSL